MELVSNELQTSWVDGLFIAVRESHKQYEKRQAELEEAEARYLGLKKVSFEGGGGSGRTMQGLID